MWTVKCKMGEEKLTALLMMRKYNSYLNKTDKQPLLIKSIVVKEGLKGFVYIEAYKQTHVKSAIEDVSNLKMGVWKQEMVPAKEMPDVLKVMKDVVKLKVGSWVRMKRTIYRDDLAQVEQVDMAQDQVTLRLIPRIDYALKRGALREPGEAVKYTFITYCVIDLKEILHFLSFLFRKKNWASNENFVRRKNCSIRMRYAISAASQSKKKIIGFLKITATPRKVF